jgi:hypothetical protein
VRYKKEKTDIEYDVLIHFPIIGASKCVFCDYFFTREFGFTIKPILFNPRVYNHESLKNIHICKVCAKTKRDAVNLFNSNLDKFELFMKSPTRGELNTKTQNLKKQMLTESEYILQGYQPTKSEIINPPPPKAP